MKTHLKLNTNGLEVNLIKEELTDEVDFVVIIDERGRPWVFTSHGDPGLDEVWGPDGGPFLSYTLDGKAPEAIPEDVWHIFMNLDQEGEE